MIEDITESYRILDLEPGATLADVKSSYRELVKVWHPDRFPNDPKFQKKGAEKLKQINAAYERICKSDVTQARRNSTSTEANPLQTKKADYAKDSTNSSDNSNNSEREKHRQPSHSSPKPASSRRQKMGRKFIQIASIIVILFIMKALFTTDDSNPQPTKDDFSPPFKQQKDLIKPLADNTNHTFREHTTTDSKQEPLEVLPKLPKRQPDSDASGAPLNLASNSPIFQPLKKQEKSGPIFNTGHSKNTPDNGGRFFTVGSTKDEVIAVRGAPNERSETEFYYHSEAKIFFTNGRVVGWETVGFITEMSGAKLLPSAKVETKEFFTLGSTKDEVLATLGTPSELSDKRFRYTYSSVDFTDGKVDSWHSDKRRPLKAKLEPSAPVVSKKYFTLDSTKDEVLAVQGTPTSILTGSISTGDPSKIEFADTIFGFGDSFVNFKNGHVISWRGFSLKTRGPGNVSN